MRGALFLGARVLSSSFALVVLSILAACGGGNTTTVGGGGTTVTAVSISPAHAEMSAAGSASTTQQFTSLVTDGANTGTWSVDGLDGGNSTVGTISASGLYTPPSAAGTHTVKASSTADPTNNDTASVTATDLTVHGGAAGESPALTLDLGSGFSDIQPEIGVTGTPVIDTSSKTMYLVSKSEDVSGGFHVRLHALSLLDGSEKFSGPVTVSASVMGNGAGAVGTTVSFDQRMEHQRCGLTLADGVVYVPWAAHEDADPYHGWMIGFNASTLAKVSVYNATPNGTRGGIWMGGGAPAVDSSNNLYVLTGNGTFDDSSANFGDSALKLSSTLSLTDWFTPYNQSTLEVNDTDLASSGLLLLPDQTTGPAHLLVASGKEGRVYLINRDSMGHFCSTCMTTDTNVLQSFFVTNNFGTPAFWQNALYFVGADFGNAGNFVKRFVFTPGVGFSTTAASKSITRFPFPGAQPSVSSNGTTNGIVWAIDASQYGPPSSRGTGPAVLHAYDATNLAIELWNSSQAAASRDKAGNAVKFTAPTIANGKVYLSTRSEIDVYGLLP
jgi:hypothetical protein